MRAPVGSVLTPTWIVVHRSEHAEARMTLGPEGVRLDLLTGSVRARGLLALDEALRAGEPGRWAERIASSPALQQTWEVALAAYRRPVTRGRPRTDAPSRAETFKALAVGLGLPVASTSAKVLRDDVARARLKVSAAQK